MSQKPLGLPRHLSHTPLYALAYKSFDEYFHAEGATDAEFISVGLATFNDRAAPALGVAPHEVLAVKVWRYGHENNRWSRLSEELPAARLIDAAITLTLYLRGDSSDPVPAGIFEGQTKPLPPELRSKLSGFEDYKKLIFKRLARLQQELKSLDLPDLDTTKG